MDEHEDRIRQRLEEYKEGLSIQGFMRVDAETIVRQLLTDVEHLLKVIDAIRYEKVGPTKTVTQKEYEQS